MNRGDWLRADRLGGETESRWQSWHLSYTKICLELFSTCLKKEPILHVMPNKRHSQVLTLCDHAFPKLFDHNRKPPERDEIQNPPKTFHSVSPAPCKQTEGAFRAGESVVKALICRSHAARQARTKTRPKTHTHTHMHTAANHATYLAK